MEDQEKQNKERHRFCAELCSAARKMGFFMAVETNDGNHRYAFIDAMSNRSIKGDEKTAKVDALENACQKLQDYLCQSVSPS